MNKTQKVFTVIFLLLFYFSGFGQIKFYTGTFTSGDAEGIYLCSFDTTTCNITLEQTYGEIENPNFLKVSNSGKFLLAVSRPSGKAGNNTGHIESFRIDSNGNLKFINRQDSHGADPCHIDISYDDRYAAIATYSGGTTSTYKISNNGELTPAISTIINEGSGPEKRQDKPHAHSIKFSPDGKQVFSADLGTDNLNIFNFKNGKLIPAKQQFVKVPPGSGPRHFTFHPNSNLIYVINELISTVSVLEKRSKKWNLIQIVYTLPDVFEGTNYCADIHISADGKYVYGSNRGHNSIAVFKTDPLSKKLEFITTVSTEGKWPRNFGITPDGNFLLVANEHSGNITAFRINRNTGIPEYTGRQLEIPSPVCIEFLKSEN